MNRFTTFVAAVAKKFVCICDAEAVAQAEAAGEWGTCLFRVGGKADKTGPPLECEATVLGLFDGRFEEPQPRHGGFTQMDQGPTAVIRTDQGLTIMLTSRRMPPFSLRQLTAHGILPEEFDLLVAKGVNAPVAAYKEACKHFIRVNTPGCTTADIERLTYKHRRKPMFPWEREGNFGF